MREYREACQGKEVPGKEYRAAKRIATFMSLLIAGLLCVVPEDSFDSPLIV
jgi:hypothetical protein